MSTRRESFQHLINLAGYCCESHGGWLAVHVLNVGPFISEVLAMAQEPANPWALDVARKAFAAMRIDPDRDGCVFLVFRGIEYRPAMPPGAMMLVQGSYYCCTEQEDAALADLRKAIRPHADMLAIMPPDDEGNGWGLWATGGANAPDGDSELIGSGAELFEALGAALETVGGWK